MPRALFLPLALLAAAAAPPAQAAACRCPRMSTAEALKAAVAVFEGHVRTISEADGRQVARLSVVRAWKGVSQEQLELSTPTSDCGVPFVAEQSYLVFALQGDDGALTTTRCQGTRPMAYAAAQLEELGMGATPFEPREMPAQDDAEPPARGGCASCAVTPSAPSPAWGLLLAAACAVRLGRRRR